MKLYDVICRSTVKRITDIVVTVTSIPVHIYLSIVNRINLINHSVKLEVRKFVGLIKTSISMTSECGYGVLRTAFLKIENKINLNTSIHQVLINKIIFPIRNVLTISSNCVKMLIEKFCAGKNTFVMASGSIINYFLTLYSNISHRYTLIQHDCDGVHLKKFATINDKKVIDCNLGLTYLKHISLEGTQSVMSSYLGDVYITKYRKLSEMDSDEGVLLSLNYFDNISLEDIDYIILD